MFVKATRPLYIIVFLLFLTPLQSGAEPSAQSLFLEGSRVYESFTEEGIRKSSEIFETLLKKSPSYAPAYPALAESYIQSYFRSFEKKAEFLEKARIAAMKGLSLDDRSPEAHKALSSVYFAEDRIEEAVSELERALKIEPLYARGWLNLGTCMLELGKAEKAGQFFTRAIELDNDPLAKGTGFYNLASLQSAQGAYSEALSPYAAAEDILPGYYNIHYGKGVALMNLNRDEEAVKSFEEAITLKPDYGEAYLALASAHHRLGNKEEAAKAYEAALKLEPQMEAAERGLAALKGKKIGCLFIY